MSQVVTPFVLIRGRVRARRCAVQALYQWQVSAQDPDKILDEFVAERELSKVDVEYFRTLICEIPKHIACLEQQLVGILDRPISGLNPVERAILLIGVYELKFRPDIPWRVVINEAIDLAKMFGAEQSYKYVNGVLDRVARLLRPSEIGASS